MAVFVKQPRYLSPRARRFRRFLSYLVWGLVCLLLAAMLGGYIYLTRSLPSIESLTNYRPSVTTRVLSADGRLIGEFFVEKREVLPLERIPKRLMQAFVAAEDGRFFEHEGFDFFSILRAFVKNLIEGEVVQGGSTITQQVAKSLLSSERTLARKSKEAILSYRIEKNLNKDQIIHLYLNQIYLGHGAYGVQAAARNYFRKDVSELDLAEMSLLAGLPQAPSRYSPAVNPQLARERQEYVLSRMVDDRYVNIVEATDAMNSEITVYPVLDLSAEVAPYFTEHVRRYMEKKYGPDLLLTGGLTIRTTLNLPMQQEAQKAMKKGLAELDKRQGYRGPLRRLEKEEIDSYIALLDGERKGAPFREGTIVKGVVAVADDGKRETLVRLGEKSQGRLPLKDMNWARLPDPTIPYYEAPPVVPSAVLRPGDLIEVRIAAEGEVPILSLHQEPLAQGSLLAVEPSTGFIRAMIGGHDFEKSKFNRAVQSLRQPGSAFKPIVYTAAVDKGFTASTVVMDTPYVSRNWKTGATWEPKNYDGKFYGPVTLRNAVANSRNLVAIRVVQEIGIDPVLRYARKMGISSPLARDLTLSLGSSSVTLQELVSAYSIFPAGGYRYEPLFITEVTDRDGKVLEQHTPIFAAPAKGWEPSTKKSGKGEKPAPKVETLPEGAVISPQTAYLMTSLLEGVVRHGTAKRALSLGRPLAGKTGTTDENRDAWFIGFTPELTTGVWVGFDDRAPLGKQETGAVAALPIFIDFMQGALSETPPREFPVPEGIICTTVYAETADEASAVQGERARECYRKGAPRRRERPVGILPEEPPPAASVPAAGAAEVPAETEAPASAPLPAESIDRAEG